MDSQSIQWAATPSQRESQLLAIVDELRTQVRELSLSKSTRTRQVLPEPDSFTGRTKEWDTWSMTMRAKLRIDGEAIGSDEAQFYYVYSSLSAKVQSLVLAFVRQAQLDEDWKPLSILDHLGRIYDDPNKAKKAGQRLMELRQGTMSTVSYIPQFERTMFEAGANVWPDNAKITTLVGGLNKYTRQRIDGQLSLPSDYNGFVQMLQTLGNQFGPSYADNNNTGRAGTMDWEPVKIAAAKTAPTASREQRQAWRDKGRCVRCGSADHWVKACTYKPTRSRSSSVSSASSSSSKGRIVVNAVRIDRTVSNNGKAMASRTTTAQAQEKSDDSWNQWLSRGTGSKRGSDVTG